MALELRLTCEGCKKPLPPDSPSAFICSFELTVCAECAGASKMKCSGCGDPLAMRPIRSKAMLAKYPPSAKAPSKGPKGGARAKA